ncbi:MAG: hypothetical protein ACOC2U_02740 [bacterium]
MLSLQTHFKKYNTYYSLVKREKDVAIFSLSYDQKNIVGYDTVIVQKNPQFEINGNIIPAKEAIPSAEMWGKKGWSWKTLDAAENKMKELLNKSSTSDK